MGYKIEIIFNKFSKKECYDGKQIYPLWALERYGISGDTFVIFRGSMRLEQQEMIDVKDIVREKALADILISSDDCIHFIIEMFDDQPANLKIAYHRLHLLAFITQRILERELAVEIIKKGTDLYYTEKKINVGIATSSSNSTKIHFGLNIVSSGVPAYVKAIGLQEIKNNISLENIAKMIAESFVAELKAISEDTVKSRTF